MANAIKYSTTGDTLSLKKGNIFFGVGDVGKGPSSATTYYNGVSPSTGGYTVYSYNASQTSKLSFHSANSDSALITYTNGVSGQNFSTVTQCLNWYATQTNYVCVNKDYETISTNSLTVCLDASFTPSYPKSGTTFYNLANTSSPLTFTMNNGVSYSTDANGSLLFDGVDDEVVSDLVYPATSAMTWNVWFKRTSDGNVFNMVMSNFMPYLAFRGAGSGADTNEFQIAYRTITGESQTQRNVYTTTKYQNNIWYNVTFTLFYDLPNLNSTAKIYVNGVLETSVSYYSDGVYQASSGSRLRIGNYTPSQQYPFPGYIGSFFVYDRVLSDSEVLQTYNSLKSRFVN